MADSQERTAKAPAPARKADKGSEGGRAQRPGTPPALGRSGNLATALIGAHACKPKAMEAAGAKGQEAAQGKPLTISKEAASLRPPAKNEFGMFDGPGGSSTQPKVFVAGGKTGSAPVHWSGGNGGTVNQVVGQIDLVAPVIEAKDAPSDKQQATAWIRPGTGTLKVTRSYVGVLTGANNSWYITAKAVARIDSHELLHVASSKGHHDNFVVALESKVAQYTGEAKALSSGRTKAEATAALTKALDWNGSVQKFQQADIADNTPMGAVDTKDLASPTFIQDRGPQTVDGKNYDHYVAVAGEPNPTPPPAPKAPAK